MQFQTHFVGDNVFGLIVNAIVDAKNSVAQRSTGGRAEVPLGCGGISAESNGGHAIQFKTLSLAASAAPSERLPLVCRSADMRTRFCDHLRALRARTYRRKHGGPASVSSY